MSIVGVTIDYGPYGFLDRYDPGHICNGSGIRHPTMCVLMFHFLHADNEGRYAYDQQPRVCRWNLGKLAEALSPLLSEEDTLLALQLYVYTSSPDDLYSMFFAAMILNLRRAI